MIFLGAGASNPMDVPTMSEFSKIALSRMVPLTEFQQNVVSSLEKWSSVVHKPVDLESLLLAFSPWADPSSLEASWAQAAGLLYASSPPDPSKHTDAAKKTIIQIESIIKEICERINKDKAVELYTELFTKLVKSNVLIGYSNYDNGGVNVDANDGTVLGAHEIFTTNYDLGLETFLRKLELKYQDCFEDDGYGNLAFNDEWSPGPNLVMFRIFKIHGSLNYYLDQTGRVLKVPGPLDHSYLGENYQGQLLIFPTGEKYASKSPSYNNIQQFRRALKNDHFILIMGYSFRDVPINNAIEDIITKRNDVKMVIVSPSVDALSSRLSQELLKRSVLLKARFGIPGVVNEIHHAMTEAAPGQLISFAPIKHDPDRL